MEAQKGENLVDFIYRAKKRSEAIKSFCWSEFNGVGEYIYPDTRVGDFANILGLKYRLENNNKPIPMFQE